MPGITDVAYTNVRLRINSTSGTVIGTYDDITAGDALDNGSYTPVAPHATGYRLTAGTTVNFFLTATVDDNARTNSYTRNVQLINIVFADESGTPVNNASDYDNVGLEAENVTFTVTK